MVVLVDGWAAEAHHHAGLAVAAAGGGEGVVRGGRDGDVARPDGDRLR